MIEGDTIRLRAPAEGDVPALQALRNDVALQELLLARPKANGAGAVRRWIEERAADRAAVFFVVARREDDTALGFVQVLGLDLVSGVGELGICLAPEAQGRGIGAEAMGLLESYLAGVFRLRKLTLKVLAGNDRAVRFYRRLGFEGVGTHRAHHYQGGRYHDVAVMEKFLEGAP